MSRHERPLPIPALAGSVALSLTASGDVAAECLGISVALHGRTTAARAVFDHLACHDG